MIALHDLTNLIQVIGVAAGAVLTGLATMHKSSQSGYKDVINEYKEAIKELTAERDEWKANYHSLYQKYKLVQDDNDQLRNKEKK